MYWLWRRNVWGTKGRLGRGEGIDPWVGRWLVRNGELRLHRASSDTLGLALRARSSTTRHRAFLRYPGAPKGKGERHQNDKLDSQGPRALIRIAPPSRSSRSALGVSNCCTHNSETFPLAPTWKWVFLACFLLRIANDHHDHDQPICENGILEGFLHANGARTGLACWSILNFTRSRK